MSYCIIIRGPLGCGKTTISKELSKELNKKHIEIDKILNENNLIQEKEEGYISQENFKKANEIACEEAIPLLQEGKPIIFDGNFYWRSQIDDLIGRVDVPYYIFTLKAPVEMCIERDRKRDNTHGERAAKAVYKKSTECDCGISIDVTESLHDAVDKIISHLPKH